MWEKAEKWAHNHAWLLLILAGVVTLRIPSLFEPYWYGDEGIYLTLGRALRSGVKLYSQIHDNKPPLLYLVAAAANGTQFWFKFAAMVGNLASIALFYWLGTKIWKEKKKVLIVSMVFAAVTTLPLLEGNIANAELFFLVFTVASFGILATAKKTSEVLLGGILLGLGALFKVPAGFEIVVWPVVWFVKKEKGWLRNSVLLLTGLLVPVILSVGYYWSVGSVSEYIGAVGSQNLPYVSSWKAASGTGIFTLTGRLVVFALLLAGVWRWGGGMEKKKLAVVVWGVTTLFAALLSGRPYPHYLLQMAGAMALGAGMISWGEKREKLAAGLVAGLAIAAIFTFRFWVYPVTGYYGNFIRWVAGGSRESYFSWFNPQVNKNYEIARVVMAGSTAEDKIFVWGDEPMIYAVSKRLPASKYTVKYHIKELGQESETMAVLVQDPPRYIVTFNNEGELPGLGELLVSRYRLEKSVDGAKMFRRVLGLSVKD